jgi:hypothetical protein
VQWLAQATGKVSLLAVRAAGPRPDAWRARPRSPAVRPQVEATKFTEVGFHGRDVDQIVRDLLDNSITMMRQVRARPAAAAGGAGPKPAGLCSWHTGTGTGQRHRHDGAVLVVWVPTCLTRGCQPLLTRRHLSPRPSRSACAVR